MQCKAIKENLLAYESKLAGKTYSFHDFATACNQNCVSVRRAATLNLCHRNGGGREELGIFSLEIVRILLLCSIDNKQIIDQIHV